MLNLTLLICLSIQQLKRQKALEVISSNEASRNGTGSFQLTEFLPPGTNSSPESIKTAQEIRRTYKDFVSLVSQISEGSSVQHNASLTMFNILTKRSSENESKRDITSYFGAQAVTQFDVLKKQSQILHAAKNRSGASTKSLDQSSKPPAFGADFEFAVPALCLDDYRQMVLVNLQHSAREDRQRYLAPRDVSHSQMAHPPASKNNIIAESENMSASSGVSPSQEADSEVRELNMLVQNYLTHSESSFSQGMLLDEILDIVCPSQGKSSDSVEARLFELLGEAGLELLMTLVPKVDVLRRLGRDALDKSVAALDSSHGVDETGQWQSDELSRGVAGLGFGGIDGFVCDDDITHGMSANQKKKWEKKMQKQRQAEQDRRDVSGSSSEINFDQAEKYLNMSAGVSGGGSQDPLLAAGFREEYLEQERLLGLQGGGGFGGNKAHTDTWLDNLHAEGTLQYHEKKKPLPKGTVRKTGPGFEIVTIPAAKKAQMSEADLIPVERLEAWAQLVFPTTKRFNQIQSKVFETAYNSAENMLVCAPTGAGKTNIALLSFLQLVKSHMTVTIKGGGGNGSDDDDSIDEIDIEDVRTEYFLDRSQFKAIYIAPMKALAQEVVTKFSASLKPLGIVVREFTGDMQLTRQEVADSQLIVTTPEKWDVVTRKGGDGSLGTMVNLIIIDEVHLLAEDRGAVIETIVARTQRYIESSQAFIRIVGLSATLPNYQDVATFLQVNKSIGLFHFGPEYRPVPLDQTFIGVTEKQRVKRNDMMNRHAYDKLVEAVLKDKQVMIFVHSRRDTSKTIDSMLELVCKNNASSLLENVQHPQYTFWKKKVEKSKSVELQNYFAKGMGVHHAGMLRADRNLTEQLYENGLLKVLCCTATLAWGVNLPGHTVIIKGTELYDPERGGYVDLSILDVFQMFGRAGRPQYDTTGHAVMITAHKSLDMYLGMLSQQAPIESSFIKALPDHLNAEIVNGTISNIKEACDWLSYTYLFVRMNKNPMAYGMTIEEKFADPHLEVRRVDLIKEAAGILDQCMMIRYSSHSENLSVTDMGRVASHYYITHGTIESFNSMLTAQLGDSEALHVLCSASEFDQLKIRPEELGEIDELKKKTRLGVTGAVEDTAGKVNVLLQSYIDQHRVKSFTLISDTNYVAQSAGRISRALFEICLKRGWASMANLFLALSKSIDRRVSGDGSVLRQFNELPYDILQKLEQRDANADRLMDMEASEIGELVRNQKFGSIIQRLVRRLPHMHIAYTAQPITRGILRLNVTLTADFQWDMRYHGQVESFWVWVRDGDSDHIYHSEPFLLHRQKQSGDHFLEFTIPIREPLDSQYFVHVVSDRWVGCESIMPVDFKHLVLPDLHPPHTDLLDVHPVPITALQNPRYESLYTNKNIHFFNPIQSQTFHVLYHTSKNVLVGAPTGSGKTITSEIAILQLLNSNPSAKTVYIAPLKALARERLADWKNKLGKALGLVVVELTGDVTPDMALLKKAHVIITTPEKWDGITRGWKQRQYVKQVGLLIIDEIHLLGVDRGPVLEVIVSRMRFISEQTNSPVRFVGLSTALANAKDLGEWLGIPQYVGLYNFRPSVRPIPMSIYIQGFPGKHYCPRMATMNKPAYACILEHSPKKPVLVFVSSRRQTRLTALDLISYCASDDNPKQFLHMPEEEIYNIAETLRDSALKDTIVFGIGIHHAGLDTHDRNTVESLFVSGKIQILVCTSTLAWGVNFPAHLVIVKGTEFFDGKLGKYVDFPVTDVLQMMGRAGRPQFDDTGVACIFVHEPKKNFYRKFLHEPFPVESSLHKFLHNHLNAEIASGRVENMLNCVDYLSWTYYFRRLLRNPSYYGMNATDDESVQRHLLGLIDSTINDLVRAGCVELLDAAAVDIWADEPEGKPNKSKKVTRNTTTRNNGLAPTSLGKIASLYYLDYRTVGYFRDQLRVIEGKLAIDEDDEEAASIEQLVLVLSRATEFAELPVRHNEELLNADLAKTLPWHSNNQLDMESSHSKAFLLLQAHFYRAELPISDYITDTKSVLDQAPRVLNAFIDISADLGLLEVSLRLLRISQMVVQGLPEDACQLLQLPHMTASRCNTLSKAAPVKKKQQTSRDSITKIKDLFALEVNRVEEVIRSLFSSGGKEFRAFMSAYAALPQLDMVVQEVYDSSSATAGAPLQRVQSDADICYKLPSSTAPYNFKIAVAISAKNSNDLAQYISQKDGGGGIYSPRYHKTKKLSWTLVLGCASSGRLCALKKLGGLSSNNKSQQPLVVTDLSLTVLNSDEDDFILFLVPDAIYGIEVVGRFSLAK
jgi:activating signal cointegrator complex subunit 3